MKRIIFSLLTLMLLTVQAFAVEEESTALRFGTEEPVSAIYASYEVETGAQEVTVTFAEHVRSSAYANFVDGKLWISIASSAPIDLTRSVGQVTAKNAEGQTFAPALTLASLRFNGQDAHCNLTIDTASVRRNGTDLQLAVEAGEPFGGSYLLCAAAYDAGGRQLICTVQTADLGEKTGSFSLELKDCADAERVKVFFLTQQWCPVTAETVLLAK